MSVEWKVRQLTDLTYPISAPAVLQNYRITAIVNFLLSLLKQNNNNNNNSNNNKNNWSLKKGSWIYSLGISRFNTPNIALKGNSRFEILLVKIFGLKQKANQILSSDSNGIWTHNHLVCKTILNHLASLAKWFGVRLRTKWLWVRIPLLSLKLQIRRLFWVRNFLSFRKL